MCGIAGIVCLDGLQDRHLASTKKMLDSISHRGPDGSGIWNDKHACFAHSRLAVIDPVGGKQPIGIRTKSGFVWMVFSGEVYDYIEIRERLRGKQHVFSGNSDSEVLLRGYVEWGAEFLKTLRGMYAIALWDDTTNKLYLVRDQLGIKPLYYSQKANTLAFGSEPKCLLRSGQASTHVGVDGLRTLLSMWPYKLPEQNIFSDICEVDPGQIVEFDSSGIEKIKYWDLEQPGFSPTYSEAVEKTSEILDSVMSLQSRSDVGIAFALSGGLDSSTLAFLHDAKKKRNRNRHF